MQKDIKSKKDIWNMENNLLRYLKRMKTGEPRYLLPRKDKQLAENFIDKLKQPPYSPRSPFSY